MMKFWKSAAKGKSGCPVRPPEACTSSTSNEIIRPLLDTPSEEENADYKHIFEEKTKLSLSLHDILIEKHAVKHFIQYMESIGKHILIKCWLELDNFKGLVANTINFTSICNLENHSKIIRTKSFDYQCKCELQEKKEILRQSPNDDKNQFSSNSNIKIRSEKNSTSSCLNLSEYANSIRSCQECEKKQRLTNITEVAIDLFKKYVALEAPCHLDLPDELRKSVISNICNPDGMIKEDCFAPVQEILFKQINNNYFSDFTNSPYYMKAQIDILTSGSLNLQDILYYDTILFYFTEYLEQESCRILLEFLMAITHFRNNLKNDRNVNAEQAQSDAIVLYDKYFSLQATSPVGFSTDIRLLVESEICREGGPLATCFDLPYKIVFKTLSKYVKTFLDSEIYYKYLSEMIHSVDQMWSSSHRSQSDCSSEFSISTQNTLLAMGDPGFGKKKRNHSVPDMTIDSNQLYNADALWQRKKQDGLSLGRVNSLGRFESKFEPDPDKKDKSVLKKMVSKFVPTSSSKVEEEMAWQIAHMIVKDVTDLTMAPPENDHDGVADSM